MTQDIAWLASPDTGLSSKAIWMVANGASPATIYPSDYPHDPGDFGRCYRLLRRNPHWRLTALLKMAAVCRQWARLVEHWDELTTLYEAIGFERTGTWNREASRVMYDRMKELERPTDTEGHNG